MHQLNQVLKRGKVGKSVTDILIPESNSNIYDWLKATKFFKATKFYFNNQLLDKFDLEMNLRTNGTRKFFQCVDILFQHTDPLIFVEIGGCTGKLIERFIEYDDDSKIYGVEPNSSLASELKMKFGERVDIENIGLGSKRDKGKLNITNKPEYSSQHTPNANYKNIELMGKKNKYKDGSLEIRKVEEFDIWTGDEYFRQKSITSCDILSLNTQGSEREILCGFQDTLKKGAIKACKIEIDMQYRYEGLSNSVLTDIDSIMSANNYRIFDILLTKTLYPVGLRLMDVLYVHKSIDICR